MKRMKQYMAVMVCFVMILSMNLPLFAAAHENHTIEISETEKGHVFEAYQIFKGDVTDSSGNTVLTNVDWGSGIDTTKTVTWGTESYTLLQALKSSEANEDYCSHYSTANTAADVVEALAKNSSANHVDTFAKIVGKYLSTSKFESSAYNNSNEPINNTDEGISCYKINSLHDGYYLVKEKDSTNINGVVHTDYILQVIKNVTVTPKDGEITVNLDILEGGVPVDACANYIGDVIDFIATAVLPSNFDEYKNFPLQFVNTIPAGLTLDTNSIEVFTLNSDSSVKIDHDPRNYEVNGNTVIIKDLKDLTGSYTVNQTTKIILKYKARLDENAIIGAGTTQGNTSSVYLKYYKSPYLTEYGRSVDSSVHVFTFKLEVLKNNGKGTQATGDDAPLEGAEFILARERSGVKQYAVIKDYVIGNKVSTGIVNTWDSNILNATTFVSDEDGKLYIEGLDLDTYWLTETKEPAGYNKLKEPIKFAINASYDKSTGRNPEGSDTLSIIIGTESTPGDTGEGMVTTTVVNNPGSQLPSTGGIGTTIFYVVGGVLVLAAVVLLVTRKRMEK